MNYHNINIIIISSHKIRYFWIMLLLMSCHCAKNSCYARQQQQHHKMAFVMGTRQLCDDDNRRKCSLSQKRQQTNLSPLIAHSSQEQQHVQQSHSHLPRNRNRGGGKRKRRHFSSFQIQATEEQQEEEPSSTTATTATTSNNNNNNRNDILWTFDDLDEFAKSEGIQLSLTTLGPGFRVVARSTYNNSHILGYGEGFIRPTGAILHLDKMEVFKAMVQKVKQQDTSNTFRGGGTTFGVGLLFGYQALLHGKNNGCTIAEFLAIDDEDYQHKRLVRYYKRAGFNIVKYVGDDIQDIPARMVWGGCGTLMRANIDDLLPFWTQLLSKSSNNR